MTLILGDEFARVLTAAQAGEEWAVTRLYQSLQPSVLRFLAARDSGEADDIASQVWLEVARALPQFTGAENDFRALVFTIARRRLLNVRRGRARRRTEVVPVESLAGAVEAPDDPAEEAAVRLDGTAAAKRVVALLPPHQAEVVLLRVVGGLSVDEVAAIVGKRPATVRVIQHRALRRLAGELNGRQ